MGVGADGSPDAVGQDAEERLLRQKYEQAMAEKRARQEAEFDAIMRQRDTIMHQSVDSARKSQEWRDSVKRTLSNGASQAQKRFDSIKDWLSDGHRLLGVAIIFAVLVAAWMFRYETTDSWGLHHRNRLTGAVCIISEECW
ncbi:MAG: hypothetical protein WBW73_28550 [Rhodoplanes sp.]